MCTLANSEDPDKMLQNEAFYQGLHCLLDKNYLQKRKFLIQFYLEIIACDTSMDHPKYQTRKKNPLVHKGFNSKTHFHDFSMINDVISMTI